MAELNVKWTAADEARARWIETTMEARAYVLEERPVLRYQDMARVSLDVLLAAERLVIIARAAKGLQKAEPGSLAVAIDKLLSQLGVDPTGGQGSLGDNLAEAEKYGCGPHYRAALWAIRRLWRSQRLADGKPIEPSATDILPAQSGNALQFVPAVGVIVLKVVGITAAALTTYFAVDRICQVYDGTAVLAVALKIRLEELQLRIAKGLPIPDPPKQLDVDDITRKLADAQAYSTWSVAGAGLLGAAAAAIGFSLTKRKAPSGTTTPAGLLPVRHANPHRPGGHHKKRRSKSRKKNPLAGGYSKDTVSHNIASMVAAGKPGAVAAAASLSKARESYRRKHPRGPFPRHLETPAERQAMKHRSRHAKAKAKPKKKHHAKPKAKPKRKATTRRAKARRKR